VPADVRAQLTFEGHKLKVLGPYAMSTGTGIVAVGVGVGVGVDPTYGTLRRAAYPQNPVTLGLCSRGQPRGPLSDVP
jgi:NAD(P)H-flavin reductase